MKGLYIGRFQPFHLGHLEAVKWILERVDEVIIGIGSSQYSHSLKNPFTAGERITMIINALEWVGIERRRFLTLPIPDIHTHSLWVEHVISLTPSFQIVFTNEPLTKRLFEEDGRFKLSSIPFFKRELYSATEIRRRMVSGDSWEELVPKPVAEYIREIRGVDRIRTLASTDKIKNNCTILNAFL
ncbi:nicotinamide-nucleotide adenylyltransferase [Candidatus Bathyarchaeota archaeon]|nr:nicotinamide-nucleotide adenylyltransferase [Candidatus Bathyarchaeota archaeon]MBS7613006.1 nicotinamide-nucleotide adenylyltransferase [Candidatus Bathyarchaeota archaeon]MBS7617580.1 nicotinamide-nucleotide adenylyltransferase [Candidatus Bathyarchaeota archaeon]